MTETHFLDPDVNRLGETAGPQRFDSLPGAFEASLGLVRQARFAIRLFTRQLDARLYSNDEFHDALSEFARRSRYTAVYIIVQDPGPAIRKHHRLVRLVQHLSSHIGVRRAGRTWQDEPGAGMLVDAHGLLWRPYGDRFEGTVDFAAGPRALEFRTWFDSAWEHSQPDPEFRRLRL